MNFRVECVIELHSDWVVFATRESDDLFDVSADSRLNGCLLKPPYRDQPRRPRPDGSPDLDIFGFYLKNKADADLFSEGQIVEFE